MGDQGTRPLSFSNQKPKEGGGEGGGGQSKSSEEKDMLDAMQTTKGVGGNGYYARVLKDHHEFEGDGVLQLSQGSEVWIEHFAIDKNWSLVVVPGSGARGEC